MENEKLFVYSNPFIPSNVNLTKRFTQENFLDAISEQKFMFLSNFNKFKN